MKSVIYIQSRSAYRYCAPQNNQPVRILLHQTDRSLVERSIVPAQKPIFKIRGDVTREGPHLGSAKTPTVDQLGRGERTIFVANIWLMIYIIYMYYILYANDVSLCKTMIVLTRFVLVGILYSGHCIELFPSPTSDRCTT